MLKRAFQDIIQLLTFDDVGKSLDQLTSKVNNCFIYI